MAASKRSRRSSKFRLVLGNFRFRRSPLDLWLGLFSLTVILGVWYSSSVRLALFKFWMVVTSVGLYYVITAVSRRYAWWLVGFCGPVTAVLVVYFLTASLWIRGLVFVGSYYRPLLSIVSIQRLWPMFTPHPNVVAGLLIMFLPFIITFGLYSRKQGQQNLFWITAVCALLAFIGLGFTKSVGAWLALAAGASVWALWLFSKPLSRVTRLPRAALYWVALLVTAVAAGLLLRFFSQTSLPGADALAQRTSLMATTWRLVQDYPFTGGGLGAFPALYAEYIQFVPNFFVSYSNLYLDVLLEVGLLGFIFLLMVWLLALWQLLKALRRTLARPSASRGDMFWLRWATLVSMVAVIGHGLTDDALFGGLGTPFLFFVPAMAILVSRRQSSYEKSSAPLMGSRFLLMGAAVALLAAGLLFSYRNNVTANWFANQGALQMDHVLLYAWPRNEWHDNLYMPLLKPASTQFQQALGHNPENRTAQQRLGLIAYLDGDFDTAVSHLNIAFAQDPAHRGSRKMLGYSYVWLGQFEEAAILLSDIPETQSEMELFISWWQQRDQPNLARNAKEMMNYLEE